MAMWIPCGPSVGKVSSDLVCASAYKNILTSHVIGFRDSIPKLVGSCVGQCEFGFRVRHVV
jgi:hypothetical protein